MRLNKKKLAALAMSAVMAASTMPFSVMAEELSAGDVVATEVEAVGEQESAGYQVDPASITFHYGDGKDFQVDYKEVAKDTSGKEYWATATATVLKQTEAKCEVPAYLWMTVTIDGQVYNSGNPDDVNEAFVTAPALEHKWVENRRQTLVAPTHFEKGSAHVWEKCSICGKERERNIDLDVQEHTWGELKYVAGYNVKADTNGYVVFDEDGEPVLVDETKDGFYYEKYFCTKDGAEDVDRTVEKVVYAKKAEYAKIISSEGIATNLVDGKEYRQPTVELPLAIEDIELKDCSKAGSYVIEYYNVEGKPISTEKITVAPHHYKPFVSAVFKTEDDMKQVVVEKNADGTLKVTNKSCYLPINYTEVTHCTAAGCKEAKCKAEHEKLEVCAEKYTVIKTEAKVSEPAGDHVIKTTAKKQIENLVKRGDVLYSELKDIADVADNFVKISARPENNCEEGGKVTVSFICVVDKETVVQQMVVDVIPSGHTRAVPERENYVAPTCTALGSYDAVVKCSVCGKELERRVGVKIPRLAHTNENIVVVNGLRTYEPDTDCDCNAYIKFVGNKVVDFDGEALKLVGKELDSNRYGHYKDEFAVKAEVFTNCTVCQDHEVTLDSSDEVTLTIVDVQKQKETGEAGYITIKATYKKHDEDATITETYSKIPYFTTMESYMGRTENIPLNGLNKDADGVYRYYVDDVFAKDFSGIVEYYGEKFFVANGVLASEANGLNEYDGKWYFLSNGQIQRAHTGLAEYNGEWFYIVNGKLDTTVNGLVPYNGGMFVFAEGRLCKEANGLWQDSDGTWYFLALGQVQTQHTGVAEYDGAFFYVRNGKLATDFNGTVEYDGAKFNVVAGQLYDKVA